MRNLESASRGVLLRCPLWFSGSRGEARCDRVTENARDDQRSDRIRAVQELAVLDRRRDGADDLPDDLFGCAEGQYGLLDRDVRRVGEVGGAGADLTRPSRLDADGDVLFADARTAPGSPPELRCRYGR